MTGSFSKPVFGQFLLGLAFGLASLLAFAGDACRIVFDMGSSGIRAGASDSQATVRFDYDFLGEWWVKHSLKGAEGATISALNELTRQAGFSTDCQKIGGGFSAWRLAAEENSKELADILEHIHAATDVAILVIPQQQEGAYGYFGSRQTLGDRLTTTHVLDIGGGSLQISGKHDSFGDALGQKIWHREVCRAVRNTDSLPCALQPMSNSEVAIVRNLLAERLKPLRASLSGKVTLTAISRPVSRSVLPAVRRLAMGGADQEGFSNLAISQVIDRMAPLTISETASLSGNGPSYAAYLLSDMLLVEGVLLATGGNYLRVAEVDQTNFPGLLSDEQAFSWERRYGCYLGRLRSMGLPAYASDPADCP